MQNKSEYHQKVYKKLIIDTLNPKTIKKSIVDTQKTNRKTIEKVSTKSFAEVKIFPGRLLSPGRDGHKVGNEAGNLALDNGRVASDHVLVIGLCLVRLGHHCSQYLVSNSRHTYIFQTTKGSMNACMELVGFGISIKVKSHCSIT